MPDLTSDIVGRIGRLSLPRTERGALTPLMEAISNSIHSVTDQFGDDTQKRGLVTVTVLRDFDDDDAPIIGFEITDNGQGFTDDNYKSFCTPDSRYKEARGGKGVGRLAWLKVFNDISVDSTYLTDDGLKRRAFSFHLTDRDQIQETQGLLAGTAPSTMVAFRGFTPHFAGKAPVRPETLQLRVVSTFLPLFLAGNAPRVIIQDDGAPVNIETMFADHINDQKTDNITVTLHDQEYNFEVWSLKCDKSVRFAASGVNFVFLAGHKRSVDEFPIDTPLGLQLLDGEYFYIACVNSPYLDDHVNAERTRFTFEDEDHDLIGNYQVDVASPVSYSAKCVTGRCF